MQEACTLKDKNGEDIVTKSFDIGSRVEVDKDHDGWNWHGGFVCGTTENSDVLVIVLDYIRHQSRRQFHINDIRPRKMDLEGFFLAIDNGFTDVVKECIDSGYDVNAQDSFCYTPLHKACSAGNIELVKYFVEEKNARTDMLSGDGELAFDMAFSHGKMNIIKYILGMRKGHNRKTLITGFLRTFQKHIPEIDLRNINLIKTDDFLQWERFLPYDECISSNIHVTADGVCLDSTEILFLSHRWYKKDHPDPQGVTCQLCKDFLQTSGTTFDYVFVDYSCICQDKQNPDFSKHIKNIPTIIFMATGCLVTPRVYTLGSNVSGPYHGQRITDARDFLSRGWCKVEAVMSMIAGSQVFCCYLFGDKLKEFIEIPGYSLYASETGVLDVGEYYHGFQLGGTLALERIDIPGLGLKGKQDLWKSLLENWWGVPMPEDPTAFLAIIVHTLLNLSRDPEMAEKIFTMGITEADVRQIVLDIPLGSVKLHEIAKMMGYLTMEVDRLQLLQIIMFFLMYCTDKIPAHLSDHDEVHDSLPIPVLQVSFDMNINLNDLISKGDVVRTGGEARGAKVEVQGTDSNSESEDTLKIASNGETKINPAKSKGGTANIFQEKPSASNTAEELQSHICCVM